MQVASYCLIDVGELLRRFEWSYLDYFGEQSMFPDLWNFCTRAILHAVFTTHLVVFKIMVLTIWIEDRTISFFIMFIASKFWKSGTKIANWIQIKCIVRLQRKIALEPKVPLTIRSANSIKSECNDLCSPHYMWHVNNVLWVQWLKMRPLCQLCMRNYLFLFENDLIVL